MLKSRLKREVYDRRPTQRRPEGRVVEAHHARVHLLHELDRSAAITRALQSDISAMNEIVVDALSVDRPNVAREKCDVLATLYVPKRIAALSKQIADVRELLALSRS